MTQLHDLTAAEQLDALARREISSVELTEHYLARIDAHGARLGAFTHVFADGAREAARAADTTTGERGPLHGLPLVLKDLHPTAGLPTTMGCAALAEWVPTFDAPAVGALRAAGAVVMGKTHAPEFGPVCYTETALASPASTPYDETRSASGSSGGSAAAVAAGLAPFAHASDGLGSIRTPAANCGLVGVKPSRGRVPGSGVDWLSLGTEGPLARTVLDAALLLDALGPAGAGELWRGPDWSPGAHRAAALAPYDGPLTVGLLLDPLIDTTVDPECLAAAQDVAAALEEAGCSVQPVDVSALIPLGAIWPAIQTLLQARIGAAVDLMVPPERRELLMPFTTWLAEGSRGRSSVELHQAQGALAAAAAAFLRLASGFDLLVTPTTAAPPTAHHELRQDDGLASAHAMLRWSAFTPWANLCGLPAVSLPVRTTPAGLPLGAQVVAGPHRDELLLRVAAALEPRFGWAARHPASW
jgi:amidase